MKEKRNDICSSIVFFLFGVFIFAGSYWIPATTSDILGSRFFPRVVAVLIGILSIFQLLSAVGELKKLKDVGVKEEKEAAKLKDKKKMVILILVAVIVPIFLNTVFWNVFSIKLPEGALFY